MKSEPKFTESLIFAMRSPRGGFSAMGCCQPRKSESDPSNINHIYAHFVNQLRPEMIVKFSRVFASRLMKLYSAYFENSLTCLAIKELGGKQVYY